MFFTEVKNLSGYELYIFILCAIVFTVLTALLSYLVFSMVKMHLVLVECGKKDDEILKERQKPKSKIASKIDCVVSFVLCGLLFVCFLFSLYVNFGEDKYLGDVPTLNVVKTSSMATKNTDNKYLFDNDINNQLEMFDLILTYKKPAENDLKLYDIVVYAQEDMLVIHRIVGIEEPSESHPNERYFLCQGDANHIPDKFPVHYSQIKGIYKDEKVPFVGSFILFMQSPAGWLCISLVVFAVIITPITEKKIKAAEDERLAVINAAESDSQPEKESEEGHA